MITPYWTSSCGRFVIYCGDCVDVMPTLGKVDIVVTDPPWGVNNDNANQSRGRGNRKYSKNTDALDFPPTTGDNISFNPESLIAYKNAVIWGANHFSDKLPSSPFWLVWDRKNGKAADSDITDCEIAWTQGTIYRTVRIFRHMWAGFQRDSQVGEKHLHPMEKPIALMQWSILWFKELQTVLDPFMGSGTTGVACVRLNRKFIGIEISKEYCDIAVERIKRELSQPRLELEPQPNFEQTNLFDEVE